MRKLHTNKGFTLAELLIVVAIIAILVAVAIPTFSASVKDANQNVTLNNFRAAYSEAVLEASKNAAITGETRYIAKGVGVTEDETTTYPGYSVLCKAVITAGASDGDSPTFGTSGDALNSQGLPFTFKNTVAQATAGQSVAVKFVFEYDANGVQKSVTCMLNSEADPT